MFFSFFSNRNVNKSFFLVIKRVPLPLTTCVLVLLQESKDPEENGADSEDHDIDSPQSLFMRKLQNEVSPSCVYEYPCAEGELTRVFFSFYFQLRQRRAEEAVTTAEEIRRMYESSNNNGHGPPSCTTTPTSAAFSNFLPHLANERLFQYTLNNCLQSNASYQQFPSSTLPNIAGLQSSIIQPSTSYQSLPPSRIPSPHHQFQRQSPPQSYNRNSPNFQSPPPAHMKRSASVSSRQSREESTSPIHQNSWSFEEQFKQVRKSLMQ